MKNSSDLFQRVHPHCTLSITRNIIPDANWHWTVATPDGHIYDASHGGLTFEQALSDLQVRGVIALDAADITWRQSHPST